MLDSFYRVCRPWLVPTFEEYIAVQRTAPHKCLRTKSLLKRFSRKLETFIGSGSVFLIIWLGWCLRTAKFSNFTGSNFSNKKIHLWTLKGFKKTEELFCYILEKLKKQLGNFKKNFEERIFKNLINILRNFLKYQKNLKFSEDILEKYWWNLFFLAV